MKILAFDVESNGLFGMGFAVGGVVLENDYVINHLMLRAPIFGLPVLFVAQHVLPAMTHTKENCLIIPEMWERFWLWLQENKAGAHIFVDVGYPVEANLLQHCQGIYPERQSQGPYPLHELATLLLARGYDPDINRLELMRELGIPHDVNLQQHHPLNDALITAQIAHKLLS